MKAREEMPLLRCALGPTGRPFGDGLHSVTASGTDGRKAVITRNWDMAGSTLKKPIRGRKMGVGAVNVKNKNGQTPLHRAVSYDCREIINLLVANGADVNEKAKYGGTPLMYAASNGNKEIAELLIAAGAEVNANDGRGSTPLDNAIYAKKTETADLLRKHGGKTKEELKTEGK